MPLTGWKTYVGMALVVIATIGRQIRPEWEAVWNGLNMAGLALGGVGLVHKTVRTMKSNE